MGKCDKEGEPEDTLIVYKIKMVTSWETRLSLKTYAWRLRYTSLDISGFRLGNLKYFSSLTLIQLATGSFYTEILKRPEVKQVE